MVKITDNKLSPHSMESVIELIIYQTQWNALLVLHEVHIENIIKMVTFTT